MKYILFTILLVFANKHYSQTNTAIVISDNGLTIRKGPSLTAKKIGVIPYKGKIRILESSNEFQKIAMSSEREVAGEWTKISFNGLQGYVFNAFLNYETDHKHDNYDTNRQHISIYTEKDFFDNIGDHRTLNIKAERLNLAQYAKDNFNTISKYDFNNRKTNGKGLEINIYDNKYSGLILIRINDLEITSERKSTIITSAFLIEKCEGITFNNLNFIDEKETQSYNGFNTDDSEQIYFTNVHLEDGAFYANPNSNLHFKYCDFNKYLLRLHDAQVSIDKCKFYNAKKEAIDLVPTDINEAMTFIKISNSFFGFNKNMSHIMEIEEYLDNPYSKLNLFFEENNSIKHNQKYESLKILVPFKS